MTRGAARTDAPAHHSPISTSRSPDLDSLGGNAADEIRVPVAQHDRAAELAHAVERLRRLRPDGDVAEAEDLVHAFLLDLREHRLERGQVTVDVAEEREPQRAIRGGFSSRIRAARGCGLRPLGSSSRSATFTALAAQSGGASLGASSDAARSPARSR